MKKISTLLAVLVAIVALAGVASAAPGDGDGKKGDKGENVPSAITLKFKPSGNPSDPYDEEGGLFSGKVTSDEAECRDNRKVKVFAKEGGRVGKAKTDPQGRYSIQADNVGPGKYFAEVKKRTFKVGKGKKAEKITCEAATSDRVRVD